MKKITLFLIFVLAAILRYYNNTAVALWHDEAFSVLYISKYGWGEMMHRIVLDVHPPLYYIILRFWSYIFGDSLLSLRSFSILLGVLTVWAGYLFVKKAFNSRNLGLLAALFLAVNPFQTQYALEARMYTLGTFLVMLSSWLLLRALESKRRKDWIFYGIAASAMFYTHYYLLFSVAAQALYALYYVFREGSWKTTLKENQLAGLVISGITAIILYLPWIPALLEQINRVEGGYWIPPMDRWSIPGTIWKIAMGGQGINHPTLFIATLVSIVALIYFLVKRTEPQKWLVALGVIVPFLAAVVLSIKSNIYLDRYFVFASLSFSILIALAISTIPRPNLRRLLAGVFVLMSLYVFWKNWAIMDVKDFGSSTVKKPGMAAAGAYLDERALEGQKIYVGSSFVFFTYQYYNHTHITPKLISGSELKDIPHFAGTAILSEDDLVLERDMFNAANYKKNEIVWLVWTTGFGGSKPNVPGNWVSIDQKTWGDTPGFKGDISVTEYRVQ